MKATPKIRTSITAQRERALEVYARLCELYPDVRCTLDYHNAFELVIMTALAAQCTDARVNIVAKDLFARFPSPQSFLGADVKEIEKIIHSCGFYRQKARNILLTCQSIVEKFDGEVPGRMEDLVQLAGVGRKTANVVLGECFGHQGVVVDTHCTRVANRLGFTKNRDAVKIEQDLMKVWPPAHWTLFSHFMVFHGRAVCTARAPRCSECALRELCPFPDTKEGKKLAR